MNKIFYEDIFISDIISNKSLTIEEMLSLIDFDEQAFRDEHDIAHALDPAEFRTIYFDFKQAFPFIKPETEELTDVDGSVIKYTFKRIDIGGHLSLFLFDSGQATLEYRNNELITFYWNDDVERMLGRLDDVSVSEFFGVIAG